MKFCREPSNSNQRRKKLKCGVKAQHFNGRIKKMAPTDSEIAIELTEADFGVRQEEITVNTTAIREEFWK